MSEWIWFVAALILAPGWALTFRFAYLAAIRKDHIERMKSLHAYEHQQWTTTETRLIDRIVEQDAEVRQLRSDSYVEREKLMSIIVTMRQDGFGGGHMEQFDEPETHTLTDADELAEYQRRIASSQGTDEELTGMVRSKLAEERLEFEEFEEPDVM